MHWKLTEKDGKASAEVSVAKTVKTVLVRLVPKFVPNRMNALQKCTIEPSALLRAGPAFHLPRSALGFMSPKSAALLMSLNGFFSVCQKLKRESFSSLILTV